MFGNAKLGVDFQQISVAKGGCVVRGQAQLNSVDVALLSEQQRAKLAQVYAAYTTVLDVAQALAPEVAQTINSLTEFIQKLRGEVARYVGGQADARRMKVNFKAAQKYAGALLSNPALSDTTRAALRAAYTAALTTKAFFCSGQPCQDTVRVPGGKGPSDEWEEWVEVARPLCEDNKATLNAFTTALEKAQAELANPFPKVWAFLQKCRDDYKTQTEGTIPRCVWDHPVQIPYSPADLAFGCGFVDGGLELVQSGADLVRFFSCFSPTQAFTPDCIELRDKTQKVFSQLVEVFSDKEKAKLALGQTFNKIGGYFKETLKIDNQARYNQGKALFTIASMFVGAGEMAAVARGERTLAGILTASLRSFAQLPVSVGRLVARGTQRAFFETGAYIAYASGSKSGYLAYKLAGTEIRLATATGQGVLAGITWARGSGQVIENLGSQRYINQTGKEAEAVLDIVEKEGKCAVQAREIFKPITTDVANALNNRISQQGNLRLVYIGAKYLGP